MYTKQITLGGSESLSRPRHKLKSYQASMLLRIAFLCSLIRSCSATLENLCPSSGLTRTWDPASEDCLRVIDGMQDTFKDGFDGEDWGSSSDLPAKSDYTCNKNYDFVSAPVTSFEAIHTIIFLFDWRNSVQPNDNENLKLAFTISDEAVPTDDTEHPEFTWYNLGRD